MNNADVIGGGVIVAAAAAAAAAVIVDPVAVIAEYAIMTARSPALLLPYGMRRRAAVHHPAVLMIIAIR
jgi:hypothetical protein